MPRNFFSNAPIIGKQKKTDDSELMEEQELVIQIPSDTDIAQMKKMPAGGVEDQMQRIANMVDVIKQYATVPIITTEEITLADHWQKLFFLIDAGDTDQACSVLRTLSATDIILQALLAIHSLEYLQQIISYCIKSQHSGSIRLNADIVVTPKTFEILIKDLATTLFNSTKLKCSFGLPTHHAYSDEGSGFCLVNKVAVLMKYIERTHTLPLKYIIVGTDVNRDNGLCNVLMHSASHMDICHVDIFDSRVYPHQDHSFISKEFETSGTDVGKNIMCWQKNQLNYFAVDLSLTTRKTISVHPALLFALSKISEQIDSAKTTDQKVVLLIPMGWDSHEDETAYCGKLIDGRMMAPSAAAKCRYNDGDLVYFYETLFKLCNKNKELLAGMYWGLEGGYDRTMYERQIHLMMQVIDNQLHHQNSSRMKY